MMILLHAFVNSLIFWNPLVAQSDRSLGRRSDRTVLGVFVLQVVAAPLCFFHTHSGRV